MNTKRNLLVAASILLAGVLLLTLAFSRSAASQSPPPPKGKPEARITVGRRIVVLRPDQVGSFPKVQVRAGSATPVSVSFPSFVATRNIVAYTLDGGSLNNGQGIVRARPDAQGSVAFTFQSDASAVRRVAVKNGKEVKVLQFEVLP